MTGISGKGNAPGAFERKVTDNRLSQFRDKIEAVNPMGRRGRPTDMAGLALYLACNASKYMTGQIIAIDGGRHLGSR